MKAAEILLIVGIFVGAFIRTYAYIFTIIHGNLGQESIGV